MSKDSIGFFSHLVKPEVHTSAEASRNSDEFVKHTVQADDGGRFAFVEVAEDGFADVGAQFLPSVGFSNNGMAECAGNESSVSVVFGDLKYDFAHVSSIAEGSQIGKRVKPLPRGFPQSLSIRRRSISDFPPF